MVRQYRRAFYFDYLGEGNTASVCPQLELFAHSWNRYCARIWEAEFKLSISDLQPQWGREPGSESSPHPSFLCVITQNGETRKVLVGRIHVDRQKQGNSQCAAVTNRGKRTLRPEKTHVITEIRSFLHALITSSIEIWQEMIHGSPTEHDLE